MFDHLGANGPTLGVLFLGFCVGLFGLIAKWPSHETRDADAVPRKQRWILKGMRPLILCGALGICLLIAAQIRPAWFGKHIELTAAQRAALTPKQLETLEHAKLSPGEVDALLTTKGDLDRQLKFLEGITPSNPPVWPVLLSGAAFLYLWWLAALIFDLGFVWHRYIRNSLTNKRLMLWSGYEDDVE